MVPLWWQGVVFAPVPITDPVVVDGDTLRATVIRCDTGEPETKKIRLRGVDAPELFAPECPAEYQQALRAKEHLERFVEANSTLTLTGLGEDVYGRVLARVYGDELGDDAGRSLRAAGVARRYRGSRRGGRNPWC